MTRLSGRVPETGTAIEGATVAIIDTQGVEDPTQWSIVANATTDANGEWSVSGLAAAATERYHAVAQYDGGTEFVNFESLPYLSTPADVFAPETALTVGTPTPTMSVGSAIPDPVVIATRPKWSTITRTSKSRQSRIKWGVSRLIRPRRTNSRYLKQAL